MKVAVAGAGIMGAATAYALSRRGHEVVVFDPRGIGNRLGSSHGRSRIVRKAYPDAFYTEIMADAYPLWSDLQSRWRDQILFEPGLLYFGKADAPSLRSVADSLTEMAVKHSILDHRSGLPITMRSDEIGIFTPEAGWVNAEEAIKALLGLSGARVVQEPLTQDLSRTFDRYAIAAGPWIREWAPHLEVKVTLQTFGYIDAPYQGPVFIHDCPHLFYGFPSEPGSSRFKIGVHIPGREIDPDQPDRTPDRDHVRAIAEEAATRFGATDARVEATGCLYTSTKDEDFRWGRHGERGYFVSACSGHGFKFGPWIGERMADFVEEKAAPESEPRFFVEP